MLSRHCLYYSLRPYQFIPFLASYGQAFSFCTELAFADIFAAFAFGTYLRDYSIMLVENLVQMKLLFDSPNNPKVREGVRQFEQRVYIFSVFDCGVTLTPRTLA